MVQMHESTQDLISVIVPVYKVERFLNKCIRSVVEQTYKELEIILVDDGSPDRCGEICDQWACRDNRIRVIHKTNGGLSDARNAGLNIAAGKYIGFVDSDDYIHPEMYQKLWETAQKYDADLSICGYDLADENGNLKNQKEIMPTTGLIDKNDLLDGVLRKSWKCVVWNKLYRRRLFHGLRFPYGKCYEDRMIMPWIFERCARIAATPEILYYYVQFLGSITRSQMNVRQFDKLEAIYRNIRFCEENKHIEFTKNLSEEAVELYINYRNRIGGASGHDKKRMQEVKKWSVIAI